MTVDQLVHNFPFDPTYGYELESLLKIPLPDTQPPDFEQFWRDTYAQAMRIPLKLEKKPVESKRKNIDLFEVFYDSWDGVRIGTWLTVPKEKQPTRAVVMGHGYGGRSEPDYNLPGPPAIGIFPCARGFHLSAHPEIPGNGHEHVLIGIESRDTYVHRGCVVDYWLAGSAVLELFPELSDQLQYMGTSFGGGIGGLLLPWDHRIKRAELGVPSFGNHPLRLKAQCVGSGESVRLYSQKHPEVVEVLRYYDSATAATFTTVPMMVCCALFDPAVCPQGQFSVYNALPGKKELFVRIADHFEFPGKEVEEMEVWRKKTEWFSGD